MQGRILIVDAIATNRIVIKVKLKKAFYDVCQAETIAQALTSARSVPPDLIISASVLPDGTAADLCRALAASPTVEQVPVIALGREVETGSRLETLRAGAHDVLENPVTETLLLARVRSLIRAQNAATEWRMREDTCSALGLAEEAEGFEDQGHCVLVCAQRALAQRVAQELRPVLRSKLTLASDTTVMQQIVAPKAPDVFVLLLSDDRVTASEQLRMIATLRANAATRHAGVIVVQRVHDATVGANALDLGADDLMTHGLNVAELALRTRAVIRRKRVGERLRASVRTSLEAAVFDPLTGLYNRRYAMPHLSRVAALARTEGHTFAVMVLDLDHFKQINDAYGHAAGDAVLIEVGRRLRVAARASDMVARIGGEEFMAIMASADAMDARQLATRICDDISSEPFKVPGKAEPISVTISIGMALGGGRSRPEDASRDEGEYILAQADRALYNAKGQGRNQVTVGRPAA